MDPGWQDLLASLNPYKLQSPGLLTPCRDLNSAAPNLGCPFSGGSFLYDTSVLTMWFFYPFFSFSFGLLVSWPQDSPFSRPTSFYMVLLRFIFTLDSPLAILPYIYNKPPPPPFLQADSSLHFFSIHDQLLLSGLCFCTEILWWSHFCIQLLCCIPWYPRYVPFKVELLVKHECTFSNFDM